MRRFLTSRVTIGIAAALIGAGVVCAVWALSDEDHEGGTGDVRAEFEPGPLKSVDLLQRSGVAERAADTVNRELDLPRDLKVKFVGEGTAARQGIAGPVYEPKDDTVYFPWSFVEASRTDLERLSTRPPAELDRLANLRRLDRKGVDRLLANAMVFVLYHEISHGLFDILDVPVVGGEEPTADSLAGILAIASQEGGEAVPASAAVLELAKGEESGKPSLTEYADDHGFDQARAFNALCLVYGSSPGRHKDLVGGPGDLTPQRADLCPFEYRGDLRSWRRLLSRRLTESGGLLPLR